jgi:transposase-like protein
MAKRKYNRKAVKGAMVAEYLDKNGDTRVEVLAAEVGVSESYAGKWLRKWKLSKKNWEDKPDGAWTPTRRRNKAVVRSKNFIPDNLKHTQQDISTEPSVSDGSTASYYELPEGAAELQDLISYKNMNAQIGEIFRAAYRYGQSSHSDQLRDAKKIRFYIDAEIKRLGG